LFSHASVRVRPAIQDLFEALKTWRPAASDKMQVTRPRREQRGVTANPVSPMPSNSNPPYADKEILYSFVGQGRAVPALRDVDVEEADGIALEFLFRRLVALDLGKARDAVALQAAVQRGACQMRDRGLKGIEAIVERQEGVLAEGDDDRLLLTGKHH
jgi:hypothetical protein